MSGMATSIDDEPGHEVLLLINVHNKRYSEYHIPVSTIKRLESIAWQKLIDTFGKLAEPEIMPELASFSAWF
jgi:hypothetical protein